MRAERPQVVRAFGDKRAKGNAAEFFFGRLVVGQRRLEASDLAQRQKDARACGDEGRPQHRGDRLVLLKPLHLLLDRVDRELVVGRQDRVAGGEEFDTEVVQVEGADAQARPYALEKRSRGRGLAHQRNLTLRRDKRVERLEKDGDRRGEPQALGRRVRPIEQQGARRLQLLGKRRLLTDRGPVGCRQHIVRIIDGRDRPKIVRELADRFAGDQPACAGSGDERRDQRKGDIGEPAGGQQRLVVQRLRDVRPRQTEDEHHRDDHLHRDRQRPAAEAGDHSGGESDRRDGEPGGDKARQRER